MLQDFKAHRDVARAKSVRHAQSQRARQVANKAHPLPPKEPQTYSHRLSDAIAHAEVAEAKQLVASPPMDRPDSTVLSDLTFNTAGPREVLIVDLPRKAHKKTLSSTFEIVSLPKVVALDDMGPPELGRQAEDDEDDWERIDAETEPKPSYAQAARFA